MPKKNSRNYKHGISGTSTYYCWQHLKRSPGGVCLSWRNVAVFVKDMGFRPSIDCWLFRSKSYQRSCPGNVQWRTYKRQFQDIWQYLTPEEVISCKKHIEVLCKRGGYDYDAGINELFLQDLSKATDPFTRIHSWIKRYLPRILSVLKKQRREISYNDEVKHDSKP